MTWQPPEDREEGYRCLGWTRYRWVAVTWMHRFPMYSTEAEGGWWTDDKSRIYPTAFAPLPPPPEKTT